jgi:hypothetical protein
MTRLRISFVVLLLVGATLYCFAADRGFDSLVSEVEHRYDVHATRVCFPLPDRPAGADA